MFRKGREMGEGEEPPRPGRVSEGHQGGRDSLKAELAAQPGGMVKDGA